MLSSLEDESYHLVETGDGQNAIERFADQEQKMKTLVEEMAQMKSDRVRLNDDHARQIEALQLRYEGLQAATQWYVPPDDDEGCPKTAMPAIADNMFRRCEMGIEDIREILTTMKRNEGAVDVQEDGCVALMNLSHNKSNRRKIASEGGIGTILTVMERHTCATMVQKCGCGALMKLARKKSNRSKITSEGGIRIILNTMRRHKGFAHHQSNGCGALMKLSCDNHDNRIKIASEGGIPVEVLYHRSCHHRQHAVALHWPRR